MQRQPDQQQHRPYRQHQDCRQREHPIGAVLGTQHPLLRHAADQLAKCLDRLHAGNILLGELRQTHIATHGDRVVGHMTGKRQRLREILPIDIGQRITDGRIVAKCAGVIRGQDPKFRQLPFRAGDPSVEFAIGRPRRRQHHDDI